MEITKRLAAAALLLFAIAGCGTHKPAPKAKLIAPARCVKLLCREADGCWCDAATGQCYHAHSEFTCTEPR